MAGYTIRTNGRERLAKPTSELQQAVILRIGVRLSIGTFKFYPDGVVITIGTP